MPHIPGLRRRFRAPELSSVEREVDDELRFHFEMRIQELVAQGMTPERARAEAERSFGDVARWRERLKRIDGETRRQDRRAEWWADAGRDLRLALRGLRRQPAFAATVAATLALGLGANVTMFGIVDRLLLRAPAHVREPHLVRRIYFASTDDGQPRTQQEMSYPAYLALRESMRSVRAIAAYFSTKLAVGEGDAARPRTVMMTTASFFPTLGARPAVGRWFGADEDAVPAGAHVAVLGYELWQRQYGGTPEAIGKDVAVGGQRFQIIGVAPPDFTGVDLERVDLWIPLGAMAADVIGQYVTEPWYASRQIAWIQGVVRLPSDGARARADAEATAGYRRALEARWSAARVDSLRAHASLEPLLLERGPERTQGARIALWLGGMSLVVLLIACANVANLLLARALRRRREVAVRVALGASRGRLVSQLLVEGVLLAALGGAGAVLVAHWGGGLVRGVLLPDVAWGDTLLDPRVLAFAGGAALLSGVLIGALPALQAGETDLVGSLKAGAREGGGHRSHTRNALVVAQAALSLVLLVGAGLFLRSLGNARALDLGFAADRVLIAQLDLAGAGYSQAQSVALYDQLYERARRLPGVRSASLGVVTPFSTTLSVDVGLPGRDSVPLPPSGAPRINAVTPEYFETIGTPILRGRGFTAQDRRGSAPVMVVSELMARVLWPGANPIGQCVILKDAADKPPPCVEVVGVAQDVRWRHLQTAAGMQQWQVYVAMPQRVWDFPIRVLYLRVAGGASPAAVAGIARALRREARAIAPRVAFIDVKRLTENIEPELRPWRLGATMFTAFGTLALVLAALGLYGVIAYTVAQRMHEMGVRIALGARPADILRLVVGQGVRVAALGVALGLAAALGAGRWVGALLFDIAPTDPLVLGGAALTLLAVAAAASLIPALRATRVPPGVALRAE